jgi:hypothetical protein
MAVPRGESARHAEVNPDDFAVAHADVARVRVRVEEAVVHHLLEIVGGELVAQLGGVVSRLLQRFGVVYLDAVHVFHYQHPLRGERRLHLRESDVRDADVVFGKLADMACLDQKIQLLLGR